MSLRPHLNRRVCCNEWARFFTSTEGMVEGRVLAVSDHRVSVGIGNGIVKILRRVDIDGIEVKVGAS